MSRKKFDYEIVFSVQTGEVGVRFSSRIYTFLYDAGVFLPDETRINATIGFIESQKSKWGISHILSDLDDQTLMFFFKNERMEIEANNLLPSGIRRIDFMENFPYGARGKTDVYDRYETDVWKTAGQIKALAILQKIYGSDSPVMVAIDQIEELEKWGRI